MIQNEGGVPKQVTLRKPYVLPTLPMTRVPPSEPILSLLAKHVCDVAGFAVTVNGDCDVLAKEIKSMDPRFSVSNTTLRRFFGLVPSKSQFTLATLNTLARYVGATSFESWKAEQVSGPTRIGVSGHQDELSPAQRETSNKSFGPGEDRQAILAWIEKHRDPKSFSLTTGEFDTLRKGMVKLYERGTLDISLWYALSKYPHLRDFIVEKFPPIDYMNTFGSSMIEEYLDTCNSRPQRIFGRSVLGFGMFAVDANWPSIVEVMGKVAPINSQVHPYAISRNLGLWLAMLSEQDAEGKMLASLRKDLVKALKEPHNIWPIWGVQTCYFQANLSEWAVLAHDEELVREADKSISRFRRTQDPYHRNASLEAVLDLRQMWNAIFLGDRKRAQRFGKRIRWDDTRSVEGRTLGMWYHASNMILDAQRRQLHQANLGLLKTLTSYEGLERRLLALVDKCG